MEEAKEIKETKETPENGKGKKKPSRIEVLEKEVMDLRNFIQQQSMLIEQLVSRVNRIDQWQIQMDVMLRNHKHG